MWVKVLGSPGRIKVNKLDMETWVYLPAAKSFFSCHKPQQHLPHGIFEGTDYIYLSLAGSVVDDNRCSRTIALFIGPTVVCHPQPRAPKSRNCRSHDNVPKDLFSPIIAKKKKKQPKKTWFSTLFSWQHEVGLLSSRRALYVCIWPKTEKCFWYTHLVTWYTSLQTAEMIMQCSGKFWSLLNLNIFIYHRPSLLSSNLWSLFICRLYFANKTRQIRDWDRKGDVWTPSLSRPCSVGELGAQTLLPG